MADKFFGFKIVNRKYSKMSHNFVIRLENGDSVYALFARCTSLLNHFRSIIANRSSIYD